MKDAKFIIIILLFFFGAGIMAEIEHYDESVNNTGIMYQENDNIVLNENNRFYDYNINYDLDESYLQYNPVKKYSFLDNSKNLAVPNLAGKEYLGDGVYILFKGIGDNSLTYNVYNGVYYYKNDGNSNISVNTISDLSNYLESLTEYTFTYNIISGSVNTVWRPFVNVGDMQVQNIHQRPTFQINDISPYNYLRLNWGSSIGDYEFTIQIEKGSTATSYEVPYIPALKIDFIGSNQLEYINPYKAQTIKINDINTVDEIEFELINTINPVVFNWNITTNPDIPFVKFYNNQTKLLYDFTDIDEINKIGNNLVASQSNIINLFDSALGLVDTFYRGFQSLFNKKFIDTIADYLRNGMTLPFMPTNFPWFTWFK